ncbi:MAG: phosphatidate cytidylyltransferase [Lachnospiraceae bacterium]|nr:phosphatidate cytidylyltransferase [Lachnospiraceae bacterium]
MKTRTISGAVLVVIAAASCYFGGPVLLAVMLFCSLFGLHEMNKANGLEEPSVLTPLTAPGYLFGIAYYLTLFLSKGNGSLLLPMLALGLMGYMTVYVLTFPRYKAEQVMDACFGFFYAVLMLSFVYLIRITEKGALAIWLVFLTSWVADTFAYLAGRAFGRHKMAPVLSPKKTIEGAVGGVLASGVAGVIYAFAAEGGSAVLEYALICMAGALISIIGDLAASAVKRDRGIKDYSHLIPGHGGILDRFDSMIFTAPVIYFLLQLLIY